MIWVKYKKNQIRKQVKKEIIVNIDKAELVLLKFSEKDLIQLNWTHDKEFEYQQQMYDIVYTKIYNDSIFYYCWLDNKETKLNIKLKKIVSMIWGKDQQNKLHQQLLNYYHSLFHSKSFEWQANIFPKKKQIQYCYSFVTLSYSFPPPVPPPKFVEQI